MKEVPNNQLPPCPVSAERGDVRLRRVGLKATRARIAILEALQGGCGPLTIEEIFSKIENRGCDLVTLYRTLSTFQKLRLVRRCDFGDGPIRYEFDDLEGTHHHHHVICTECRSVESLDLCWVEEIEKHLQARGYRQVSHSLEFYGVCQKCSKNAS